MTLIHETYCFQYFRTLTGYTRVSKFGEVTEHVRTKKELKVSTFKYYFNTLRQDPDPRFQTGVTK